MTTVKYVQSHHMHQGAEIGGYHVLEKHETFEHALFSLFLCSIWGDEKIKNVKIDNEEYSENRLKSEFETRRWLVHDFLDKKPDFEKINNVAWIEEEAVTPWGKPLFAMNWDGCKVFHERDVKEYEYVTYDESGRIVQVVHPETKEIILKK